MRHTSSIVVSRWKLSCTTLNLNSALYCFFCVMISRTFQLSLSTVYFTRYLTNCFLSQAADLSLLTLRLSCLAVIPPFSLGTTLHNGSRRSRGNAATSKGRACSIPFATGQHIPSRLTQTWPSNRPSMEHAQHLPDLSVLQLAGMVEHAQRHHDRCLDTPHTAYRKLHAALLSLFAGAGGSAIAGTIHFLSVVPD